MKKSLIFFYLLSLLFKAGAADVIVGQTEQAKYKYRIKLASLILEKTASQFGVSKIVPYHLNDLPQDRAIMLLAKKKIDLLYLPPTEELLQKFAPIKIDIHNGMLGYRVFIIRKSDKERFAKVKTIDDLRKFKGGFGRQWGDFKVFGLNKLPVVGVNDSSALLQMLSKGRFDYFHRGLHEAWAELEANKQKYPDLMVEENITLVYDLPVYYIFNKGHHSLKKRFEIGFNIINTDGSFKELFLSKFGDLARKANLKKRTLIRIKYPTPKELPPTNTSFWLD